MNAPDDVLLDLDAAAQEIAYPDGLPIRFGGKRYLLPAEFPVDVLDPLLAEDFDLVGLIVQIVKAGSADVGDAVIEVLTGRPDLPREFRDTIYECLRLLMGAETFAAYQKTRPSIPAYARLIRGLFKVYGTSLGEATASLTSSVPGGATSNQTSDASTDSTPAASSDAAEPAKAS